MHTVISQHDDILEGEGLVQFGLSMVVFSGSACGLGLFVLRSLLDMV